MSTGASGQAPLTSDNIQLVYTVVPTETDAISLEFARTGHFLYASSLDSISVYDISDPRQPLLVDTLVNATFENESMTYGERVINGELKRFVIVGIDLVNATPSDPEHIHIGFDRMLVVDVTDASKPFDPATTPAEIVNQTSGITIEGDLETTTSTHTVQCVSQENCRYAYTAGSAGEFEIIDMTDPFNPTVLKKVKSPAGGPNKGTVFGDTVADGAGHYWDFDDAGVGWHTGSGGAAAFDVSDPTNPKLINATNPKGVETPYNDFIHHNSARPNADEFKAGQAPNVDDGNVLLVTEEDYANDGEEVLCEQQTGLEAGTFQTWHIPRKTDATPGTLPDPSKGNIEPLDIVNAPSEFATNAILDTPVGAFCSAHWFDFHRSGIVAQGYYQQGLWLEDVRDAKNIKYYGHYTPVASEVWDAYWVPKRDKKGLPIGDTNLIYTADAVRGIDVLEVKLPAQGGTPQGPPNDPDGDGEPGVGDKGDKRDPDGGVGDTGQDRGPSLPATGGGLAVSLLGVAAISAAAFIGRRRR